MKKLDENYQSNLWLPSYTADSVSVIDFDYLKSIGIKACLFDLDHTLLVHGEVDFKPETVALLQSTGLDIYIATNRRASKKLDNIAAELAAKGVMNAGGENKSKPSATYYKKAVKMTGYSAKEVVMVGDRLVQDVWGARRAGLKAILVNKFGVIKWYDQILTIHDRLIPVMFRQRYSEIKNDPSS